MADSMATMDLL